MKCFAAFFLIGAISLSTSALGQSEVGNGADLVLCGENLELLDLHEGRLAGDFTIDLGPAGYAVMAKLRYAVKKLARLDEELERLISQYLGIVSREPRNFENVPDVNDEGDYDLQDGCILGQLAVQRLTSGRHFFFSPFYHRLSADHQAATLLHEAIYAVALDNGHGDSERARRFVRLIVGDRLTRMSAAEYLAFKAANGFDTHHALLRASGSAIDEDPIEVLRQAFELADSSAMARCEQDHNGHQIQRYTLNHAVTRQGSLWRAAVDGYYLCRY